MVEQKENIGYRIMEAVLAVLLVLFALSYFNNHESNSIARAKHDISTEVILSLENAVVCTEYQVIPDHNQEIPKIKFPEEKFNSFIISENRKNDFFIMLQRNKASEEETDPVFVCYRRIFPPEKDEVPLAS